YEIQLTRVPVAVHERCDCGVRGNHLHRRHEDTCPESACCGQRVSRVGLEVNVHTGRRLGLNRLVEGRELRAPERQSLPANENESPITNRVVESQENVRKRVQRKRWNLLVGQVDGYTRRSADPRSTRAMRGES